MLLAMAEQPYTLTSVDLQIKVIRLNPLQIFCSDGCVVKGEVRSHAESQGSLSSLRDEQPECGEAERGDDPCLGVWSSVPNAVM